MKGSDVSREECCGSGGESAPEQVLFNATAPKNDGFINYRLDPVE
jgi:hypothetical protein